MVTALPKGTGSQLGVAEVQRIADGLGEVPGRWGANSKLPLREPGMRWCRCAFLLKRISTLR